MGGDSVSLLTNEDKERIKEEERYRSRVRDEIKDKREKKKEEKEKVPWWKPKGKAAKLFVAFIFFIFIINLISGLGSSTTAPTNEDSSPTKSVPQPTKVPEKDLNGSISVDGGQFIITNLESRDWESCRFTLNGDYRYPQEKGLLGSETEVVGIIDAKGTYTIGSGKFTLKDGTRFNIFSTNPIDFSISCENGFGYWSW